MEALVSEEFFDVLDIVGSEGESAGFLYLSENYSLQNAGESKLLALSRLDPLFLKFDPEKAPAKYAYEVGYPARKLV